MSVYFRSALVELSAMLNEDEKFSYDFLAGVHRLGFGSRLFRRHQEDGWTMGPPSDLAVGEGIRHGSCKLIEIPASCLCCLCRVIHRVQGTKYGWGLCCHGVVVVCDKNRPQAQVKVPLIKGAQKGLRPAHVTGGITRNSACFCCSQSTDGNWKPGRFSLARFLRELQRRATVDCLSTPRSGTRQPSAIDTARRPGCSQWVSGTP